VSPDSRDVEPNEELEIEVKVKHKVTDEELRKKVKATLNGVKTVEPPQIDQAPGTFTYTAGPNDGDSGGITFKSTSNRGIGEKTVTYTVSHEWSLDIDAHVSQEFIAFSYDLDIVVTGLTISPVTDGAVLGSGNAHVFGPVTLAGACTGTYDTQERITFSGGEETTEDGTTLITLHFQFPPGGGAGTISCPPRDVTIPIGNGGGFGQRWANVVGEVVVAVGGSVEVDKTANVGGIPTHATGTITVTPK
jgi:hypothetical protein